MNIAGLLLEWRDKHRRRFPWRDNPTPYRVLVAEMLLQRTPAERVARYYDELISAYPDIRSLSHAKEEDIAKLIGRLGLSKRVRWLIGAAKAIMSDHAGDIPSSYEELIRLPGVGDYTASAVLCFGYGKPVPLVDANVARVVSRIFDLSGEGYAPIKKALNQTVPHDRVAEFYEALLDLAALVCRKKPICNACPVVEFCSHGRKLVGLSAR